MGVLRAASVLGLAGQSCAFTFLSIGDWGDPAAKQLNPLMGKETPEFVLAIGDNFYSKGVTGVTDPQWDTKFEKTFTAPDAGRAATKRRRVAGEGNCYGQTRAHELLRCRPPFFFARFSGHAIYSLRSWAR